MDWFGLGQQKCTHVQLWDGKGRETGNEGREKRGQGKGREKEGRGGACPTTEKNVPVTLSLEASYAMSAGCSLYSHDSVFTEVKNMVGILCFGVLKFRAVT